MPQAPDELLTSAEVAELLKVHRKQIYRLMRRGLPARRVGGEWRFSRSEILAWAEGRAAPSAPEEVAEARRELPASAPPLLAANGDLCVELLLAMMEEKGPPLLGFVRADRMRALTHLQEGAVLLAGCHGEDFPVYIGGERLARVHLVAREVGLGTPPTRPLDGLASLSRLRFGGRPPTAGVTAHLTAALLREELDPEAIQRRAVLFSSHQEVACAVARGEVDVGLLSRAWAARLGLGFFPLATEPYGLLVRAKDLGEPAVVRLCEVAQSIAYREKLKGIPGYDPMRAGDIRYDSPPSPRDSATL